MSEPSEHVEASNVDATAAKVDVSRYKNTLSLGNRVGRTLWTLVWAILFRLSFPQLFAWRRLLLRCFGAKIGKGVKVYPSCRVWAPWNLRMDDYSCLASNVECYSVAQITIGEQSTVSQYTYLCAASHAYSKRDMPLTFSPIVIADQCWICADVFIGPGVTVGTGAVVGAKSCVVKDVAPWAVVGGNPVRFIKRRVIEPEPTHK